MSKSNKFESLHGEKLKAAEEAALDALEEIVGGKSTKSPETDAMRVDVAKLILSVRADDA